MKRILLALTMALPLFVISCGKDKKTPYGKTITGVNLTNIDATPAGTLGVDDSKASTDSFEMHIYPVPCYDEMNAFVLIYNTIPVTLTAKLVNVTFPGAPGSFTIPYTNTTYNIVAENKDAAGTVALTQSQNLDIAPPIQTQIPPVSIMVGVVPIKANRFDYNLMYRPCLRGFIVCISKQAMVKVFGIMRG